MATLEHAINCVNHLQVILEDFGDGESVVAGITWTPYTMGVFVGEIQLWDDQTNEFDLTIDNLRAALGQSLKPYMNLSFEGITPTKSDN